MDPLQQMKGSPGSILAMFFCPRVHTSDGKRKWLALQWKKISTYTALPKVCRGHMGIFSLAAHAQHRLVICPQDHQCRQFVGRVNIVINFHELETKIKMAVL